MNFRASRSYGLVRRRERQLPHDPTGAGAERGDRQAVSRQKCAKLRRVDLIGGAWQNLDGIEAVAGGTRTTVGKSVVKHERTAAGLGNQTDRDGRFHGREFTTPRRVGKDAAA